MTDTRTIAPPAPEKTETGADGRGVEQAQETVPQQLETMPRGSPPAENPLRAGLQLERVPAPCVMVIFGVSGDLTARKLMPALYDLTVGYPLPEGFAIIGVSHRDWNDETFREEMRDAVAKSARTPVTDESWRMFASRLSYVRGDFADPAVYTALGQQLAHVEEERRVGGNRLFYLATAPRFYGPIIQNLGTAGLARRQDAYTAAEEGWQRIVIEKPFGRDLASAEALNAELLAVFSERQIYRIDHYLGKETVQNILAFRFANVPFEPVWNNHYVDNVQITVAESLGVEGRGGYYDKAGALRDMVQSHMLQLLSIVAMEPPAFFNGDALRNEKVKVLRSVVPPHGDDVATLAVRGQYGPGFIGGGPVPGYREEPNIAPDSKTETYAALKLYIDNWRWADVPFYLRTGKRLPRRVTEIALEFKRVPHLMFQSVGARDLMPNVLTMRIQPDEGIALRFAAKVPGPTTELRTVRMDFLYGASFGEAGPDAYERLLLDSMLGDQTLFARADEVEVAWALVQPILDYWSSTPPTDFPNYEAGTWGPQAADALIERDGREWRRP